MKVSVTLWAVGVGAIVKPAIPGELAFAAAFAIPAAKRNKMMRYSHSIPRSLIKVIEVGEEKDFRRPIRFILEVSLSLTFWRLLLIPML